MGRVGLEPTTGGYEKPGPVLRTRCLYGYHGAVPPMALIALVAPTARSTNRSTTAAPDPLVLLLSVTPLAAPGRHPREQGPMRQ